MQTFTLVAELLKELLKALPFIVVAVVFVMRSRGASEAKIKEVERVGQLAEVYVGAADAAVRELKNPHTQGTFTDDDAAAIKADVLKRLRKALGDDVSAIEKAIGNASLEEFLDDVVESKVTLLRTARPPGASATVRTVVPNPAGGPAAVTSATATTGDGPAAATQPSAPPAPLPATPNR